MKIWLVLFGMSCLGLFHGCSIKTPPVAAEGPAIQATQSQVTTDLVKSPINRFKPGDLDETGHLIMYMVGNTPIRLEDEVGLMLINEGEGKTPKATYLLGERLHHKLVSTQDKKEIFRALAELPEGSRIRWYDTCTFSRSAGLPPHILKEIIRKITKLGYTIEEEPNITCYCTDGLS